MENYKVPNRVENVHSDIRGPIYKEALRMSEAGEKVLKLNTGNPGNFGFKMPESLRKAITDNMERAVAYSESNGTAEVKAAIAAYHKSKGLENVDPSNIYVGNGVSEIANLVTAAYLEAGDEVLLPMPNYGLWSNCCYLTQSKPVFYMCDEKSAWMPDLKDMESKVTAKTKAIVIINPNNPTGALYPREILAGIADIARRHNLLIFADEIYDRLVMDGAVHESIAAVAPDVAIVTFNGLSKSHVICGIRSGWMILNACPDGLKEKLDALMAMRLCGNTFGQFCIPAALGDPQFTKDMLVPGGRIYEQREATYNAIKESECLSVVKNTGALYCFPKINQEICPVKNDKQFAMDLLKAKHIMIVPGSGFDYTLAADHFRVVMLPEAPVLADCIRKIDDFCKTYKQV